MPPKVNELRKGLKAVQDLELIKVLKSEIEYELNSNTFKAEKIVSPKIGSLGDFKVDWDSPNSKDLVLRRRCNSGEEVAVSAILGPLPTYERGDSDVFPRDVFMNVFVKKPTLSSILQFNCRAFEESVNRPDFDIKKAHYFPSPTCMGSSVYGGPKFSELDPELQNSIKQYLIAKGIEENLIMFLISHLHKKEQEQYVNWLKKGKSFVEKCK